MSMGNNIFARTLQYFVIGTPEEMTRAQIDEAVEKFADAAEIMAKVNFARVEIHASHGYLGVCDARVLHYDIRGIKIFNLLPIATIGSDVNTLWHNWRMHRVAIENQEPDPNLTVHGKIFMVIIKILKKSTSSIILFFTILFISFFVKQIFLKHNEKIITEEYNYTINKQKKTIVRLYNIICL
ncbi:unnamed protein product [Rotaria sp. Silwood2]|nr:unnamed protein product [Rotaria sp. Silwood2]